VLCFRRDHFVQCYPKSSSGDGKDGVDCPLSGGVCSHSALPHNAADCDGLLEVSKKFNISNMIPEWTKKKKNCRAVKCHYIKCCLIQKYLILIRVSLMMNKWAAPHPHWPHPYILSHPHFRLIDTITCMSGFSSLPTRHSDLSGLAVSVLRTCLHLCALLW